MIIFSNKDVGVTLAVGAGQAVSDVAGQAAETAEQVTKEAGKAAQDLGEKTKSATEGISKGLSDLLKQEKKEE